MLLYGAPGICPQTAFQIINHDTVYIFSYSFHPPPYPFLSVLRSNTNGNIFYRRSKIKLFQWYSLSLFFFLQKAVAFCNAYQEQQACCQISTFPCFVSFAAIDSACWKSTRHITKMPSLRASYNLFEHVWACFQLVFLSCHDYFYFAWYPYRQYFKI